MELAGKFICVLASNSLWMTGSGLVLWLCLRKLRLSPGTRAAASILVVLQGWIWIGIPVQLGELAQPDPTWNHWQPAEISLHKTVRLDAFPATTAPASDSPLLVAVHRAPELMPMAGVVIAAIWMVGLAIILWRSLSAYVALSRIVHALPLAPAQWQQELSALCVKLKISRPLALKVSNVATPMLLPTWGRACIVVPAWLWDSCTAEQRTSILLHELAHLRRGDIWRQLAVRLLVLPHWFNPVAWWAARQFEAAIEAACDEAACGGNSLHAIGYAKALLILSERLGIRYAHSLSLGGGSLTERIRRVLHPEFRKESQMSRFLMLSSLMLLTGLAAIRIQAAGPPSPAENEAAENASASSPVVSLIANGGFEEPQEESGDPHSWYATRIPHAGGTSLAGHYLLSVSPKLAHSGQRSVMVAIGDNHPDVRVAYNWTTEVEGWKAGETYELSGWTKVEKAQKPAFIMVQFWDKNEDKRARRMIGGATTEKAFPIKGDAEWTKVSTRFTVPEGTGSLRLRAGLSSSGNPGAKAWFDDLSLVKVADLRTAEKGSSTRTTESPR